MLDPTSLAPRYTVFGSYATIAGGVIHIHDIFVHMTVKDAPFDDGESGDGDGRAGESMERSCGGVHKVGSCGTHSAYFYPLSDAVDVYLFDGFQQASLKRDMFWTWPFV
jgi:hypothetical protein